MRREYMIRDSGIEVLLDARVLAELESSEPIELNVTLHADHIAYVIYTSGSTGKPKGVAVRHGALSNFMMSMAETPGLDADDVLLAVTPLSFDIAGLELFLPLSRGRASDPREASSASPRRRVAATSCSRRIPSRCCRQLLASWRMLLAAGWEGIHPRRLTGLCGGEALQPDLADQLLSRGVQLRNMHGPTETTVWSSVGRSHGSLGRPIAATTPARIGR